VVAGEAEPGMTLKERITIWYLTRRIVAAVKKGQQMTPLPKWLAWLGNLGAVGTLLAAVGGVLPPKYAAIVSTLAALLNSISHSLPGTGGK